MATDTSLSKEQVSHIAALMESTVQELVLSHCGVAPSITAVPMGYPLVILIIIPSKIVNSATTPETASLTILAGAFTALLLL